VSRWPTFSQVRTLLADPVTDLRTSVTLSMAAPSVMEVIVESLLDLVPLLPIPRDGSLLRTSMSGVPVPVVARPPPPLSFCCYVKPAPVLDDRF
jgi:hypothetical protein